MASARKMEDGWVRAATHKRVLQQREDYAERMLSAENALQDRDRRIAQLVADNSSIASDRRTATTAMEEATARAALAEGTMAAGEREIAETEGTLQSARVILAERDEQLEKQHVIINQQAAALDASRTLAEAKDQTLKNLRDTIEHLHGQVREHQKAITAAEKERGEARSELRQAEGSIEARGRQINAMGQTIARMEGFIEAKTGAAWPGEGVENVSLGRVIDKALNRSRDGGGLVSSRDDEAPVSFHRPHRFEDGLWNGHR